VQLFNEHWETEEKISLIKINNFVLASHFSRRLHVHGGTAIFIKPHITYKICHDILALNDELNFEVSAIEIMTSNNNNIVFICLRTSNGGEI
jgi:hypothetical protein